MREPVCASSTSPQTYRTRVQWCWRESACVRTAAPRLKVTDLSAQTRKSFALSSGVVGYSLGARDPRGDRRGVRLRRLLHDGFTPTLRERARQLLQEAGTRGHQARMHATAGRSTRLARVKALRVGGLCLGSCRRLAAIPLSPAIPAELFRTVTMAPNRVRPSPTSRLRLPDPYLEDEAQRRATAVQRPASGSSRNVRRYGFCTDDAEGCGTDSVLSAAAFPARRC
jgi:hypothetical protein